MSAWAWFILAHAAAVAGQALFVIGIAFVGSGTLYWFGLPTMLIGALLGPWIRKWASDRAWAEVPGAFGLLRRGEEPWPIHPVEWTALSARGLTLAVVCAVTGRLLDASSAAFVTAMCADLAVGLLILGLAVRRWRQPMGIVTGVGTWVLSWGAVFTSGNQGWNLVATWIGLAVGVVTALCIAAWKATRRSESPAWGGTR